VAREEDIVALVERTVGHLRRTATSRSITLAPKASSACSPLSKTVEHYPQVCDINIRGVLLSMKHEIPAMLRSGGGAIVNNSSVASFG